MDDVLIRTCNPWNKGKLIGQKAPFKLKEIWAIRVRLQIYARTRELALFDFGIDSKLRGCEYRQVAGPRYRPRRPYRRTRNRGAKKDLQASAVRNHRANAFSIGCGACPFYWQTPTAVYIPQKNGHIFLHRTDRHG